LYDQGFTIGGAPPRPSGRGAKGDVPPYHQPLLQMIAQVEEVLLVLKKRRKQKKLSLLSSVGYNAAPVSYTHLPSHGT
ncbi:hypothetical protein M9C64_28430, partial [Pseudomonas aeruginosa]|nr:hypothetical protein [Pseudomonas aeruginosa]